MLLVMCISLYTSRVVLATLGVSDYGTYNIIAGVVTLLSFINSSLGSATQRCLNYELGKEDSDVVNKLFSTAVLAHIFVAILVVLIAETVGLWVVNSVLKIPPDRMDSALIVYQFSILTVCISFIQIPFYASVVAYEKMSFFAYVAIIEVFLKLLLVYLLTYSETDKLILYAVLIFSTSVIIFLCHFVFCYAKIKTTHIKFCCNKRVLSELLGFGGWMLLGSASLVGSNQGVNIVINHFLGVSLNATMGVCNQVNSTVNKFVQNFQTAFVPQLTKAYAVGDIEGLQKLTYRSSRFSFLLLFAIACPLMLNMDFILDLWLVNCPAYATEFCILILIYSLVDSLSKPIGYVIHATGKVKKYNICLSLALSLNIIFSYLFLKHNFVPYIVIVISVLVSLIWFALRLVIAEKLRVFMIRTFLSATLPKCLVVSLLSLPIPLCLSAFYYGWQRLIVSCVSFFIVYGFLFFFFGLFKEERETIVAYVHKRIVLNTRSKSRRH